MSWISKTENQDKNEKWVKLLQIPFFQIRSSDMHYFFLPAFYFCLIMTVWIYGFYFWLDIRKFSLWNYLWFLKNYRYEVLLFIIPFSFIIITFDISLPYYITLCTIILKKSHRKVTNNLFLLDIKKGFTKCETFLLFYSLILLHKMSRGATKVLLMQVIHYL